MINLAWKPGKIILRFIFYKIIVKVYWLYLSLTKKIGWTFGNRNISWLASQKLIHFSAIFLTVLIIVYNLKANSIQAMSSQEMMGKTFLSELIADEFGESDELIEEYFDEEIIISSVQQTYLDNLSSIKIQPFNSASNEYDWGGLSQDGRAIIKPDIATTKKSLQKRTEIVEYIVQAGDTVSTIADQFDVSVNTILWENNLTAYSLIRSEDKLIILPETGISHKVVQGETIGKIAKMYDISEEKIIEYNKIENANSLFIGQKLLIPGGKKLYSNIAKSSLSARNYTGISAIKDLIAPKGAKPVSGNKMNWPTQGYRITQYYSWRHAGLDIANKIGTSIYAADTGVVEYVGWGRGYGNQIVIDHGGGKKTRYAHLSNVYVVKGEEVVKGQSIGAMGSTGWSTGSHLHFEVIINGAKYNPLNYIK